ncbi:hypothetical protein B0T11DRAFT_145638 [Plectosphaerella cucumerina]|uniref:Uncharacterized protein n=1 Tax=Plectosphaerella cucumerina TaxID=40658 RepID=A0A8K0TAZ1_9PEZI|nr:hypothetical protein B0T11DRAFT_145638 [Plectosphaerella cucumerina]
MHHGNPVKMSLFGLEQPNTLQTQCIHRPHAGLVARARRRAGTTGDGSISQQIHWSIVSTVCQGGTRATYVHTDGIIRRACGPASGVEELTRALSCLHIRGADATCICLEGAAVRAGSLRGDVQQEARRECVQAWHRITYAGITASEACRLSEGGEYGQEKGGLGETHCVGWTGRLTRYSVFARGLGEALKLMMMRNRGQTRL